MDELTRIQLWMFVSDHHSLLHALTLAAMVGVALWAMWRLYE